MKLTIESREGENLWEQLREVLAQGQQPQAPTSQEIFSGQVDPSQIPQQFLDQAQQEYMINNNLQAQAPFPMDATMQLPTGPQLPY
jgi:hypothetical protein